MLIKLAYPELHCEPSACRAGVEAFGGYVVILYSQLQDSGSSLLIQAASTRPLRRRSNIGVWLILPGICRGDTGQLSFGTYESVHLWLLLVPWPTARRFPVAVDRDCPACVARLSRCRVPRELRSRHFRRLFSRSSWVFPNNG